MSFRGAEVRHRSSQYRPGDSETRQPASTTAGKRERNSPTDIAERIKVFFEKCLTVANDQSLDLPIPFGIDLGKLANYVQFRTGELKTNGVVGPQLTDRIQVYKGIGNQLCLHVSREEFRRIKAYVQSQVLESIEFFNAQRAAIMKRLDAAVKLNRYDTISELRAKKTFDVCFKVPNDFFTLLAVIYAFQLKPEGEQQDSLVDGKIQNVFITPVENTTGLYLFKVRFCLSIEEINQRWPAPEIKLVEKVHADFEEPAPKRKKLIFPEGLSRKTADFVRTLAKLTQQHFTLFTGQLERIDLLIGYVEEEIQQNAQEERTYLYELELREDEAISQFLYAAYKEGGNRPYYFDKFTLTISYLYTGVLGNISISYTGTTSPTAEELTNLYIELFDRARNWVGTHLE